MTASGWDGEGQVKTSSSQTKPSPESLEESFEAVALR
jgi:hypothetical protein